MRRSPMKPLALWSAMLAACAGLGLMYFGDPDTGLERRQRVWGMLLGWLALGNRPVIPIRGNFEPRSRARPSQERPVDDATLAERVRHEIFRDPALRDAGVQVSAEQGIVTLRGEIANPARLLALVAETRDVPGVIRVQNLLHSPAKPETAKAPPGDLPDVVAEQTISATPTEAALEGVDIGVGFVEVTQPVANQTRPARGNRARTAPKPPQQETTTTMTESAAPKTGRAKSTSKRAARQAKTQRASTAAPNKSQRATGTKRGTAMQPDSYDQEPITTQKPTQDENVDFQILETPQMKEAVEANNPQQAQSSNQSSQGSQPQRQQTAQATSSSTSGGANDSGLPGGGVGRREDPGHTGVYPMSASDGASGDAPVQNENAFGQGDRGAAGYQDSGGSAIYDIPDANTGEGDISQSQSQ